VPAAPPSPPPRLRPGDRVTGHVTTLAPDGESRASLDDGTVVRLRGGVPGDRLDLRILHRGQNATWAEIAEVTAPSPARVEPPCPHVAACGGCPWQAVSLDAQRAARDTHLRDAFGPLVGAHNLRPLEAVAAPTGYRTRAMMMARHVDGALRLGFYAPRSTELVPAEGCPVQHPTVNAALLAARDLLAQSGLTSWRGPGQPGTLRAVVFKIDPKTDLGLLTIIATRDDPRFDGLGEALREIPAVAGVHLVVNPTPNGQLLRGPARRLAGASRLSLHVGALSLLVGPAAFVQTHHAMTERMVETVLALSPPHVDHVADLYAGVGLFGLALRSRAAAVSLVESNPEAIRDARANASRLPDASHVAVYEGDAAALAERTLAAAPAGATLVLLDPPRAGAHTAVLDAIATAKPQTVLYVSCHPKALARDAETLANAGYTLDALVPFEMFPHTPHLEAIARFTCAS